MPIKSMLSSDWVQLRQ